jgi:hypothetical protein
MQILQANRRPSSSSQQSSSSSINIPSFPWKDASEDEKQSVSSSSVSDSHVNAVENSDMSDEEVVALRREIQNLTKE